VLATADYGSNGNTPSDSHPTYKYGAQMNFPLFTGGERNSRVAEQESQIREAQIQFDDIRRRSQATALAARQTLQQAIEMLDVRVSQRSAAVKQFQVSRSRVKAGFADSLEALDAQAQAAIALDQWQEAWATYQTARINLMHSMGQMEKREKL
jgi:outer membrane protein TolC